MEAEGLKTDELAPALGKKGVQYPSLEDRTLDLDVEVAHSTMQFLLDDELPDAAPDWAYVHHLFSPPYLVEKDCSTLCAHELGPKSAKYSKESGRTTGWCCNQAEDDDPPVPYFTQLMGASEAEYLHPHLGEYVVRSYEDPEMYFYLCSASPCCPRQWRSFWCRAFPFLPLMDADGYILGVCNIFHKASSPASVRGKCYLNWKEIRDTVPVPGEPDWNLRFILGWEEALKSEAVRLFVHSFLLEPFQEQVYNLDLGNEE